MNEALEAELRKTRLTIYAIVASFQEPSTSGKILREYTEEYGGLTHEKFGYQHLEKLLDDHPQLFPAIDSQGRRAYKAKVSDNAASQALQFQIQRQKKKKKKSNRRGGYNRAAHGGGRGASIFTNGSLKNRLTFERLMVEERQQSCLRGRGITRGSPKTNQRGRNTQPPTLRAAPLAPLAHWLKPQMPLNAGYFNCPPSLFQSLLQPPLMKTTVELEKYFGTGKLSSVRAAMKDDIVFEVLGSDEILIKTKAFVERTRNDRAQEKDKVEVDSPRATMAPRLTELMEHFTMQLVNMYPNPIPLSDVGIFYSRHYGAEVNPERLYAKHWSDLFATTFSSRTMVKDGSIHLREAYVKKHNIKPKHVDQSHAKAGNLQLAMINDLNESSLESGDESEEEEEDKCDETIAETGVSLTSIPLEPAPIDLISTIPLPPEPKPRLVLQTQRSSTVNAFQMPFETFLKAKMPEIPEPPKANAQDPPFRLRVIDKIKKPNQIKEPENQRRETPHESTIRTHTSIASSVLPQRTRCPMLLSKVTEKSYP
ncbi:unnamed protein product, partial [Mesorhabditis belari]|uniref:HTH OST-type domain-containing protein n=1 Tax=Mesorhabditis belari TaxID=2138241 RepID=A0AAF3EHU8_9BILA